MIHKTLTTLAIAGAEVVLAGCPSSKNGSANRDEQRTIQAAQSRLIKGQPIPAFSRSQLRQTLIDIETAQAGSVQTTSFFFNQGVKDPIDVCPSIGFAIPSTAQLSNPSQIVTGPRNDTGVVSQLEPTGIYTGDSQGTYVLCVDDQGRPYGNYWEGNVKTVTGAASWDKANGRIKLVGAPTGKFTKTGG